MWNELKLTQVEFFSFIYFENVGTAISFNFNKGMKVEVTCGHKILATFFFYLIKKRISRRIELADNKLVIQ